MASTRARWMNPTDITIGGFTAKDNLSFQAESGSSPIGSSSENDTYANHFLQAVEKGDRASLRIYDIVAAATYLGFVGTVQGFSCYIPKASEGDATTGFTVSSTITAGAGAFVESVNMGGGHNTIWEAEVSLIFRTPDGVSSGLPLENP